MEIGGSPIPANSTMDFVWQFGHLPCGTLALVTPHGPLDPSWRGLTWCCWVDKPDQLTVRIANVTGRPITPAPQEFRSRTF